MKILLLAGSGEGRALAQKLAEAGHDVLASLAGATKEAARYACDTRVGGFGGAEQFEDFAKTEGFELVIDATHPFAVNISRRTLKSCQSIGLPYLQLMRPEWLPNVGDQWHLVDMPQEAHQHIEPGATVFLATGRQTLPAFENLSECTLICRQIDPPDAPFPYPNGKFLIGRPPFSVEDEVALFSELMVDVLVVKNAGGAASRSKLDAARRLEIPVVMINRAAPLDSPRVETVEEALDWVAAHADY